MASTDPKSRAKDAMVQNDALRMMGIKKLKIPSPKWLAFWATLSVVLGGIAFDKWAQKQQRRKYMELVKPLGDAKFGPEQLPRKIRVYAAPPPNDYLAETDKYFRRWVKPMLNSAGIDFVMITEDRQGKIRTAVAEDIRKLRRAKLGLPDEDPNRKKAKEVVKEEEKEESDKKHEPLKIGPSFSMATNLTPVPPVDADGAAEAQELKKVADLYNPSDVLGVTKQFEKLPALKIVSEDSQAVEPQEAGGILCMGRGAYKEYIHGVHEGLLGPLYEPERPPRPEPEPPKPIEEMTEKEKTKWEKDLAERKKDEADRPPLPYILPEDYSNCELAPELDLAHNPRDENGVPYFFLQPVQEMRIYNVSGFSRLPDRVMRFYTKRSQQIDYNERLYGLVQKKFHKFIERDMELGAAEEEDWPAKWKAKSRENGSDWCRDFSGDDRVQSLLSVYDKIPIDLRDVRLPEKKPEVRERKPWVK